MRIAGYIILLTFLTGCAAIGSSRIKDVESRSTVYGWLDYKDAPGSNSFISMHLKQLTPEVNKPYYQVGWKKLDEGIIFWSHHARNGEIVASNMHGRTCLIAASFLCDGAWVEYEFGEDGNAGYAKIDESGVYFMGAYKMTNTTEKGIFSAIQFGVEKAESHPTQKEMLELILATDPTKYPEVSERIKDELARLP